MNKQQQSVNKKGFTIIEVVLVLAIAGLIFLMVFIALPNLQRGQRDSQRKSDLARIVTQISNYQSNSRGNIPDDLISPPSGASKSFVGNYLGGTTNVAGPDYKDPQTGNGYEFKTVGSVNSTKTVGEIYYNIKAICANDGAIDTTTNVRQFTLRTYLEGQDSLYCVDGR